MAKLQIPFFRADISDLEIQEVNDTLRSGWLTSGPKVRRFEQGFAEAVGAKHAVAVNSCTAALHLAVEALELKPQQAVLVPTMTFAATAEVVRYQGALPVLVDCDRETLNMDLSDAARKLEALKAGRLLGGSRGAHPVGIIPVHVGGLMMDVEAINSFAAANGLWVVEDAAHALPSSWRKTADAPWQRCGENSAAITCFSFYANKTITTGEGGMAVTDNAVLGERMRCMSLHGLSRDAWDRYSGGGSWDYQIIAAGFKYNLTDIAAAIGIHQLSRAEEMRSQRERLTVRYLEKLEGLDEIELAPQDHNRIHSRHLFPIKLRLDRLSINRNEFIEELKKAGVGCSVHWRPLHLHPYYRKTFGWREEDFPVATAEWSRLISLPIFPSMRDEEQDFVLEILRSICWRYSQGRTGQQTILRKTA